jgi:hypothetical protein
MYTAPWSPHRAQNNHQKLMKIVQPGIPITLAFLT